MANQQETTVFTLADAGTDLNYTLEQYLALQNYILAWHNLVKYLADSKKNEAVMRLHISKVLFPDPREGANNLDFEVVNPDGTFNYMLEVSFTHRINRTLDEPALPAVFEKMSEGSKDVLIKNKPSLVLKAYKALVGEDLETFNQAVTSKPGMGELKIKG